ncbi:uncharacterized protein N7482_000347 [Penicillium canariense]|uniref:F-box domain-containing protein n=1 Tax=Penicillium canariense TaxID=189055 RepID=A0A9W9LSK5_9EURO|nr:uncharacterized protein N7482_000347 [Penicillium canariense]KAJ5174470.1 hypothetical protein N7482_000347 [Penicillium canariense]
MAKPTLEGLPAELLIIILSQISDWESLRSIVLSSPTCHRAYLASRHELLYNILKRQYGQLLDLPEAITAIRSKGLYLHHNEEEAIALLDRWRRRDEISRWSLTLTEPIGLEEVIKLLHLHKQLQFFLEDYSTNIPRPSWMDPAQWEHELPLKMSDCEKRRFLRALYRLYTHANIFGLPEVHPQSNSIDNGFDNEQAYRLFFGAMPPWEYQEIGCVWSYLMTQYGSVFNEISHALRNAMRDTESRFFGDVLPDNECPPSGVVDTVDHLEKLPKYAQSLTSVGPDFLYRVLHAKPLHRRNLVIANLRTYRPLMGCWLLNWVFRVPFTDPADRYDVPYFKLFWSTLPPIDQPNLGWKRLGLMPHTPEQQLEDVLEMNEEALEQEWPWGYALWDDSRLKAWKAPLLKDRRGYAQIAAAPPLLLLTAP